MLQKAKEKPTIKLEFVASRGELIRLVNAGQAALRMRGRKKEERAKALQEARKRCLELHKSQDSVIMSKYKVQTVERYKETHNGRTPAEDGLETTMQFHQGKMHEVTLHALEAEGEWELQLQDRNSLVDKTTIDNGESILRSNQIDVKKKELSEKVQGARMVKKSKEFLNPPSTPKSSSSSSSSSSDDEDHESLLGSEDSDDLLASIVPMPSKGNRKLASKAPKAPKDPKAPKAAQNLAKAGGGSTGGRVKGVIRREEKINLDKKKADRKKAPVSEAVPNLDDQDLDGYLERNGFLAIEKKFHGAIKVFCIDQTLNEESFTEKTMASALKLYLQTLASITKECTGIYWKFQKRKDVPDGANDRVSKLRQHIASAKEYMLVFTTKNLRVSLDLSKLTSVRDFMLNYLQASKLMLNLPMALESHYYMAQALEFAQTGLIDTMLSFLTPYKRSQPVGLTDAKVHKLNYIVIENGVTFFLDSVAGENEGTDAELMSEAARLVKVAQSLECFSDESSELQTLETLLQHDVDLDAKKDAKERFEKAMEDQSYAGFYRSVASLENFPTIMNNIEKWIQEKSKEISMGRLMANVMGYLWRQYNQTGSLDAADVKGLRSALVDFVEKLAEKPESAGKNTKLLLKAATRIVEHSQTSIKQAIVALEKFTRSSADGVEQAASEVAKELDCLTREVEASGFHDLQAMCTEKAFTVVEKEKDIWEASCALKKSISVMKHISILPGKLADAIAYRAQTDCQSPEQLRGCVARHRSIDFISVRGIGQDRKNETSTTPEAKQQRTAPPHNPRHRQHQHNTCSTQCTNEDIEQQSHEPYIQERRKARHQH